MADMSHAVDTTTELLARMFRGVAECGYIDWDVSCRYEIKAVNNNEIRKGKREKRYLWHK